MRINFHKLTEKLLVKINPAEILHLKNSTEKAKF